jgi:phosphate:Na+ symporter
MSANIQGKRLACAHLIFNVVTGLIAIILINQLILSVDWVSAYVGIAGDDYTLKLAVFHTIFNLIGIIVMIPFIDLMVRMLQKFFKEKEFSVEQPKYLTDSALEYADTAIKAVRMETLHLYDNAIDIMAKAIGFSKSEIDSGTDLEQLIKSRPKIAEMDIDASYDKNIKGIYSAIIAFSGKARFNWELEQSSELHWLRKACKDIVDSIKSTKHLQKNLIRYVQSQNEYARKEYQSIRLSLALLLRELEEIKYEADPDIKILSIDGLKLSMEEADEVINNEIDELIRKNKISPEIGTSLINDSAYEYEIKNNLIQFFETLFVAHERELTKAERKIALNDDEITSIKNKHQQTEATI